MNKGQVFLSDLVASAAVFSLFIVLFGLIWNISIEEFQQQSIEQKKGAYTFETLKTQGVPGNWNSSNVEIAGIYSEKGSLNGTKLLELDNLSAEEKTSLLESTGYLLEAEYLNGSTVEKNNQELRVNSSSKLPQNKSIYTYRDITLQASDKKRVKINYYMWTQ